MQSLTKKGEIGECKLMVEVDKRTVEENSGLYKNNWVLKDIKGNYIMLGSKEFEQLVMERKPLVDTRKHSLHEQRYKGIITVISQSVLSKQFELGKNFRKLVGRNS